MFLCNVSGSLHADVGNCVSGCCSAKQQQCHQVQWLWVWAAYLAAGLRSGPDSPGAGSECDDHLHWVCQPKPSWPVQCWGMIMPLSLFDLSDYPGNQRSYWKGITSGPAGELLSWTCAFLEQELLFLEVSTFILESLHCCLHTLGVHLLLIDSLNGELLHFLQALGNGQPFGFLRNTSTGLECKVLMEIVFLGVNTSPCPWRFILLVFEVQTRMLLRPLPYLPPPRHLYVIS